MGKLLKTIQNFLQEQNYSSYYSYEFSDHPNWEKKPANAIFVDGAWKPANPDGFTIGNEEVFAAIGTPLLLAETIYEYYQGSGEYRYEISPSIMSLLVGPNKKEEHLKVLFNSIKAQDIYVSMNVNGKQKSKLGSKFINKSLKRIKHSGILVSDQCWDELSLQIIDVAPQSVIYSHFRKTICRFLVISNMSNHPIENLKIGPAMINFGSDWNIKLEHFPQYNISPSSITEKQRNLCKVHSPKETPFEIYFPTHNVTTHEDPEEFWMEQNYRDLEKKVLPINSEEVFSFQNTGAFNLSYEYPKLIPGETMCIPLIFILDPAEFHQENTFNLEQEGEKVEWEEILISLLMETLENDRNWAREILIETSDIRIDDLIDTMLFHLRQHIGNEALHTGSLYYSHHSAFVRDNYMLQRGLMKAGRFSAGKKNVDFFTKAFRKTGLRNSYSTYSYGGGTGSNEMHVEIPAYIPMMIDNLMNWTREPRILFEHAEVIKACYNLMLACENDLFILNSDEMWIWATYVNEMDYYLDTSWVMIAGILVVEKAANLLDDSTLKQKVLNTKKKWIDALNKAYIIGKNDMLANSRDANGIPNFALIPSVISRPIVCNMMSILEENGCDNLGQKLLAEIDRIWLRVEDQDHFFSDSRTTSIIGNTPGLFLYATVELDRPYKDKVLAQTIRFLNTNGSVNEIHDAFNPAWGTERCRAGDTSNTMEGILHYLFGIIRDDSGILINPHPPYSKGFAKLHRFPTGDSFLDVEIYESNFFAQDSRLYSEFSQLTNELEFELMFTNAYIKKIFAYSDIAERTDEKCILQTDLSNAIRWNPELGLIEAGIQKTQKIQILSYNQFEHTISINIENLNHEFSVIVENSIFLQVSFDLIEQAFRLSIQNNANELITVHFGNDTYSIQPQQYLSEIYRVTELPLDLAPIIYQDHPFLRNLNQFIDSNGNPDVVIMNDWDFDSYNHILQILQVLAVMKGKRYPLQTYAPEFLLYTQSRGKNIILVCKDETWAKITQKEEFENVGIFSEDYDGIKTSFEVFIPQQNPNRALVLVRNHGHVFQDTLHLCSMLERFVNPTRDRAISMHPFGEFRLSDGIGKPVNNIIPLKITATKEINFYIQGKHYFGNSVELEYKTDLKSEGFKPIAPFCSLYSITPYAPLSVAAAGIATGKNCIHFISEMESDQPLTITFEMYLPQTFHPLQMIGGIRERIRDPSRLFKLPSGEQKFVIEMHPGRPTDPLVTENPQKAATRSFNYTFANYP